MQATGQSHFCPREKKRDNIQRIKCQNCRYAKQRCDPPNRQWPRKCDRCIKKKLPCTEGQLPKKMARGCSTSTQSLTEQQSRHITLAPKSTHGTDFNAQLALYSNYPNSRDLRVEIASTTMPKFCTLASEFGAANRLRESLVLLSIHAVLIMALQELKVLGDEMSSVFLNDPYHTNPTDRLQGLQSIFTSFKEFALNLKEHILGMGAGGPLLSEALFTLESDYSHHSITLVADDSTQHMEDAISRFQSYGQHEFAHILLLKRFLGLNEITNDDTHRFIQSRKQFLTGCKDVLQRYGLEEPVAVILLNSQMYLPSKLLQIPDISNHVLEIGFHDCLGRSVSHVLSDAGNVVNWPRNPGHDADLLGRTSLYTACYKGDEALTKDLIASRRVDLKYQAKNGLTPLHIAACMGHTSICDIIWDACTPREFHDLLRDRSGRSPLLWAALRGHQTTVARLCKLITHLFPLDIESLAAADKDNFASTAVILATCGGHIEVVQYLLSCNGLVARFPVDEVDLRGHTAMEYAKKDSNTILTTLLRRAGRVHQENVVASGFSYLMDFNEYDGAGFNFPCMFTKP